MEEAIKNLQAAQNALRSAASSLIGKNDKEAREVLAKTEDCGNVIASIQQIQKRIVAAAAK